MKIIDGCVDSSSHRKRLGLTGTLRYSLPVAGAFLLCNPPLQAQNTNPEVPAAVAPAGDGLIAQTRQLLAKGDYVEAQLKAEEAIAQSPDSPPANFVKGEVLATWYLQGNGGEPIRALAQRFLGVFVQRFPAEPQAQDALKLLAQLKQPVAPPPPPKPAIKVPDLLNAARTGSTQVTLQWEDVEDDDGYRIEGNLGKGFETVIELAQDAKTAQVSFPKGTLRVTLRVLARAKDGTYSSPSREIIIEFPQFGPDFDPSDLRPISTVPAIGGPGMCQLSPSGDKMLAGFYKIMEGTEEVRPVQVGDARILDVNTGQILQTLEGYWAFEWDGTGPRPPFVGHFGKVNAAAWDPKGAFVVTGAEDGTVCLWNFGAKTAEGKIKGRMMDKPREALGQKNTIVALHYAPARGAAEARITALTRSGHLVRWDPTTGNLVSAQPLSRQMNNITCAAFCPDGTKVAVGTGQGEGTVNIFNASNGASMRSWFNAFGQEFTNVGAPVYVGVSALAWTPDNENVASASYAHVYFNNIRSNSQGMRWFIARGRITTLCFASDGRTLAGSDTLGDGVRPATPEESRLFVLETDENTSIANPPRVRRVPSESARALAFVPPQGAPGAIGENKIRLIGITQTGSLMRLTAPLTRTTPVNATSARDTALVQNTEGK